MLIHAKGYTHWAKLRITSIIEPVIVLKLELEVFGNFFYQVFGDMPDANKPAATIVGAIGFRIYVPDGNEWISVMAVLFLFSAQVYFMGYCHWIVHIRCLKIN